MVEAFGGGTHDSRSRNNVIPALEGIEGVSEVQISGQQLKEVMIDFDEDKLIEYGLDEETIQSIDPSLRSYIPVRFNQF